MRLRIAAFAFAFISLLSASTYAQEQEALSRPPEVGPLPSRPPSRIRVEANVEQKLLLTQAIPVYPEAAKAAHVCGTILLHAIINKDGTVQRLEYISGPRLLLKSAMDAVRQWRYRATELNDEPVEVDTKISIVYKLGKSCG
jgi:periplasmic protein TonB